MNTQMAQNESHGYNQDPHSVGGHSEVVEAEDDQNHGKKSVLKKVKAKAKKIKDTIVKHGHGHDHDHHHRHDDHGYDEDDKEDEEDEELVKDPEIHGAPIYEAAAVRSFIASQDIINPGVKLGESLQLQEDPDAPKDQTSPGNYQAKTSDPTGAGGEEVDVTAVISSFEKLEVSNKSPTGSHDQFSPEPQRNLQTMDTDEDRRSSYTEKISSATSTIADKAVSSKNTVAAAVSEKLAPVYEKVACKMQGTTSSGATDTTTANVDKGVSVKEYLAKKLKPGEEDKALSEVISEVLLQKRKEEKEEKKEMGKVTESPEVASRLGTESDSWLRSNENPGRRIVDRLREAATSWFGKGGETNPSQAFYSPSPASEQGSQGDNAGGEGERKAQEQQS